MQKVARQKDFFGLRSVKFISPRYFAISYVIKEYILQVL